MPDSRRNPKCIHCGHAKMMHTTAPTKPCAKRIPIGWRGRGVNKRPIMGYCPCPRFEAKEDE